MQRKIVLIVSLVCGLVAALLTRTYLTFKEGEVKEKLRKIDRTYGVVSVLTFARDMPSGSVISDADLTPRDAPAIGMRGHALSKENLSYVVGRKLINTRRQGEVAFWTDIEGGNPYAKGLSSGVKRKMRAMSVNVSGAAAVSGMVKPNDHVDVIGTFNFPDDEGKIKRGDLVTSTILQNVLVLATGRDTAMSQSLELGSRGSGYTTVTLEVTPREAEMLAFAEQIKGRLVLTLRNPNDTYTEAELPQVDYLKIREEIEELNKKRQLEAGLPSPSRSSASPSATRR